MRKGFSLVELSIVIVILGLLIGGVLAGKSLIRASELRSVSVEYQRYVAAANSFRDKYFYLPGDIINATSFWGSMTNCAAASPSGTGTQTCNGDGDGQLDNGAADQTGEVFGFWQHLANAGLVEGTYSGISGSTNGINSIIGTNVPPSKLNTAGWNIRYIGVYAGNSSTFAGSYGNMLELGADTPTSSLQLPVMIPSEAWNIDTKMDDGVPGTGKAIAKRNNCTNATAANDYASTYVLTSNSADCFFMFARAF